MWELSMAGRQENQPPQSVGAGSRWRGWISVALAYYRQLDLVNDMAWSSEAKYQRDNPGGREAFSLHLCASMFDVTFKSAFCSGQWNHATWMKITCSAQLRDCYLGVYGRFSEKK